MKLVDNKVGSDGETSQLLEDEWKTTNNSYFLNLKRKKKGL